MQNGLVNNESDSNVADGKKITKRNDDDYENDEQ
jgi:hypothetical protein